MHTDVCMAASGCRHNALILRSLTVLEGLALSADPNYRLLGRAYPYIARRLLTDPAPQLRCAAVGCGLRRAEPECPHGEASWRFHARGYGFHKKVRS